MEAKLRQFRRHITRLLLPKLNPYPFTNNLAQFPNARGFIVKHIQDSVRRESAIVKSLPEINPMQFFRIALCGPVLEPRI
jgi:hypothetical protein